MVVFNEVKYFFRIVSKFNIMALFFILKYLDKLIHLSLNTDKNFIAKWLIAQRTTE